MDTNDYCNFFSGYSGNCVRLLTTCCLIAYLFSCDLQTDSVQNENTQRPFSTSYQPPVFAKDDRVEKIKDIAPAVHQLFEAHSASRNIPGIAYGIVVDNELVLASATGQINLEKELPATINSSFRIASMTKSFTAMAILKLRDEGKLSLDDPVENYLPEMSNLTYLTKDAPIIDIENLLTMTSGFPEDNPWGDRQLDEPDQMLIDLIKAGVSFSNASSYRFEYSNLGYALLGNIVSRVSGKPYQEYIREHIFQPLGMEHTYWEYTNIPEDQLVLGYRWEDEQWKIEPILHDGSFGAMGGLITSIEDFSKYVSFHLSAWPPRSGQETGPVSRNALREMHTPQFTRLNAQNTDRNGDPCPTMSGYGYGLGITRDCEGRIRVSHGGALPGFGSSYVFFPKYGVGVMAFGNLTYTGPLPFKEIEKLLFDSVGLQSRQLPVSDILLERQQQVAQLIQNWDPGLEAEILAENFYLDKSRDHRMSQVKEVLDKAGPIKSINAIEPHNQLRGTFKIISEHGLINVFFTLTPELIPKVQQIDVWFEAKPE